VSTAMSTRIAAGVTAAYVLDLSRSAAAASAPVADRAARAPAHGGRRHGAGRAALQASRRARLGATLGGSSGCLG
jgi:hypothetical protein